MAEIAIQQQINNHPTLRQQLINVYQAGGIETLKPTFRTSIQKTTTKTNSLLPKS
ncbi:hypothetical protein [Okeania sp. KiyG1]|uniref:hypothetical protein n=1 Tax=Okeania sp. KiyG1 TaxID=2720165 RepID=UPI0019215F3A|nr:hypothetical protein [Okeania sp. KiyG1]